MAKGKSTIKYSKLIVYLKKNLILVLGITLLSIFFIWRYHQIRILSFNSAEVAEFESNGIKPIYIKSYPIGIDVDIKQSTIKNGVWTINPSSANYLVESAGIGDKGNIIIYGHNSNDMLGPLRYIKEGAVIDILASDGVTYQYRVIKTDTVNPDDLRYIQNTSDETLTIYTCTDIFDSKRFVAVAKRIEKNNVDKEEKESNVPEKNSTKVSTQVTTAPIIQKSTPLSTSSNLITKNIVSLYITYYGFNDNDPPGTAIAYPKSEFPNAIHDEASGNGTFENPLTFASDPNLYPVGTRIYVPYIKKYIVMEDLCATCVKNYKNGRKHIDIWAGGDGSNEKELYECENDWTRESESIEVNPPNNREVDLSLLCF